MIRISLLILYRYCEVIHIISKTNPEEATVFTSSQILLYMKQVPKQNPGLVSDVLFVGVPFLWVLTQKMPPFLCSFNLAASQIGAGVRS